MVPKGNSDQPEIPDLGSLGEEMEKAMAQARKAMADLPPLDELGGLQAAMAGLAGMGTVIEMMRLAAQRRDELVAELAGEPNWQVGAEIDVKKGMSSLMKVELAADFDLETVMEVHDMLSGEEAQGQIAAALAEMGVDVERTQVQVGCGWGIALLRQLNLLEYHFVGAPANPFQQLRLTPEASMLLKVSAERELCFEFASALTIKVPIGDRDWEKAELPKFTSMIDEVRVALDDFRAGKPFQRELTVSQGEFVVELKLAFRPL